MIVETDTETGTAGALAHQTIEAIDEVRAMSMPTPPAETTVTVSARTDTLAVMGWAMPGFRRLPGRRNANTRLRLWCA